MKNNSKQAWTIRCLLSVALMFFFSIGMFAQSITVKGVVKDDAGEPIIGASVVVKGTSNGTITDFNGNFELQNVPQNDNIEISFVGYVTQTLKPNPSLNVTMKEDTQALEEVVVVGYGVQKKSVVTAAISKVSSEDLNLTKQSRVEDALKGKISGVQITQSSGQPNSDSKVRIRGIGTVTSSEPLYIVDGMPVGGGINYLNPNDIACGKDRTPAIIAPNELREKHFAPYLAAVRQGALTIMANSGSINGMPVHANRELLTQWLKEDLNWDGMIVTDWADIDNLWKREKVAKDKKEAIKMAINAGIDMSMDPYDLGFCRLLKELVEEGEVPMSRIDDATRRVLRLKYRLGLFDQPTTDYKDYPEFGGKLHAEAALQSATESMILLKNESELLPLSKGKKILLTGPNANQMRCLNGGWSYTWQGHLADQFAGAYHTIYEAMCNEFGLDNVILEQGVTYNEKGNYWEENEPQIQRTVAAAGRADVIVACVGENSYCETPGNLTDLTLSQNQRDLVKALAKTGNPIVLVLNGGRPRIIADIEPLAKSVVNILLPGNYGGDALADLLSGEANFSGKMPYTYPKEVHSLINYDYKNAEHIGEAMEGAYNYDAQVSFQWAFGYGLSYNDYEYDNFQVNKSDFMADDELIFTVNVTNKGTRVGKESVLLFSSDLVPSLTPDNRRLRNFEKVELQPGETRTVTLKLKGSDLAFVGVDGKWRLEEGDFRMQAGSQVLNIHCSTTKVWNSPNK